MLFLGGFHPSAPILPYDWSKYGLERSFDRDVNCSWVAGILLASKGKGHRLAKIVCPVVTLNVVQ
jgi:hypothetical protein